MFKITVVNWNNSKSIIPQLVQKTFWLSNNQYPHPCHIQQNWKTNINIQYPHRLCSELFSNRTELIRTYVGFWLFRLTKKFWWKKSSIRFGSEKVRYKVDAGTVFCLEQKVFGYWLNQLVNWDGASLLKLFGKTLRSFFYRFKMIS